MNIHNAIRHSKVAAQRILSRQQRRHLTLHEYQGQDLLREYGVRVPRGKVARSPAEVGDVRKRLGRSCILKPTVLTNDERNGTFPVVNSVEEAETVASSMLGISETLEATSSNGLVRELYVTEAIQCASRWYLTLVIDRESYCPAIVLSRTSGSDITSSLPRESYKFLIGYSSGITPQLVEQLSRHIGPSTQTQRDLADLLRGTYDIFKSKDATMVELSIGCVKNGKLQCISSSFTFDNAAEKRQPEIFTLRDKGPEVAEEIEAEKYGLIYVRMDGDIGNIVNGAGLAMATNDAIGFYGGTSANFLDAGGQATKDTMVQAFRIVLRDERVKALIVNVYGGITNCAMIAESVTVAATELGPLQVPVVVRLQGTNSEQGLKLIQEANLGLHVEADFGKAAKLVVELARR